MESKVKDEPIKAGGRVAVGEVEVADAPMSDDEVDEGEEYPTPEQLAEVGASSAQELAAPIDSLEDKWKLVPAFMKVRGLVKQHIESFNHLIETELQQIVKANSVIKSDVNPNFFVKWTGIRISPPHLPEGGVAGPSSSSVTPHNCRLRDLTYHGRILVDVEYVRGRTLVVRKDVHIGYMPLMLRSSKCVLSGKNDLELAKLKECPHDPGGYFIVKGVEKVVLIHEQLSKNRILIEADPKTGGPMASVTSSTHEKKSRSVVTTKNGRFYFKHSTIGDEVPVMMMFKAMGVQSEQEIVSLIGLEEDVQSLLSPSFLECELWGVHTEAQALNKLGERIAKRKTLGRSRGMRPPDEEAREVLNSVVMQNVHSPGFRFRLKAIYLAQMVRRVVLCKLGRDKFDDKDYYGNKRLELAGTMIALLFEDLFKRFQEELKKTADLALAKASSTAAYDPLKSIRVDLISNGLINALSTGNWSAKRFKLERAGVTEQLTRLSYISILGMMTRVKSNFEKTRKVSGPRALQPSQWGMLCPSDTPEGEACGLVKNLALLAHITSDADDRPVVRLLFDLGVEDVINLCAEEIRSEESFLVYLNGLIIGIHYDPLTLAAKLRSFRRCGLLGEFVSVFVDDGPRAVRIACDGGRICRPLIIVKNGRPCLTREHLDALEANIHFNSFLSDGSVEYLDVSEENNAMIAASEAAITSTTTHLEIDPMTVLGVVAGLIPYPHHNQSPRNTYQCAMGKQAMGCIAYNQFERIDTVLYFLVYPMKPLVTSRVLDMIDFDSLPAGQNAVIAVMSYSGYDIEDAIVLNKSSLDRGFGRCIVTRKHVAHIKSYPNGSADRILGPPAELNERLKKKYGAVDKDGLPRVGSEVYAGSVLVNRQTPVNTIDRFDPAAATDEALAVTKQWNDQPLSYKGAGDTSGYVDRVMLSTNEHSDSKVIKVIVRQVRRPEPGDKFSSRHGQKGVCGLIVQQEDMPFNDTGICPDLIMNPHGFPSRMTVGKMIELLAGKASVMDGVRRYGTAFGGTTVDNCSAALVKAGYHYAGKEYLTSGLTGEPLPGYVFFGPVFYQKLKHMVVDKLHSRARGPKTLLTRQPTEGRARDGGLRMGEMERDCLVGYGASMLLVERLMISSDMFDADVCKACGVLGAAKWCQHCQRASDIVRIRMPYACKLLFQELGAMNIVPRLQLRDQ